MNNQWIARTEQFLQDSFSQSPYLSAHPETGVYRLQHSYRVANIGKEIAKAEGLDITKTVIACLLHDISYQEEFQDDTDWKNHGRRSAAIARPFLSQLGMDEADINDICYAIAIHVDDKADFSWTRTAFSESVGDADNIDRFDAYRIYEALQYKQFSQLPFDEKEALVSSTLEKLAQYRQMQLGTQTATTIWTQRIDFYTAFYEKLSQQLSCSNEIL